MVKKIPAQTILMQDYMTDNQNSVYDNTLHDKKNQNHAPHSNGQKKLANKEAQNGSNKTEDKSEIEDERNEKFINGFNDGQQVRNEPSITAHEDTKRNSSNKSTEYTKFFKFYFDKHRKEHPKWTSSQISTIISLMWKKKKNHDKTIPPKSKVSSRRSNKALSAKDAFKQEHKHLTKEQIKELWTKLPQQSKNFWKTEGQKYQTNPAQLSEVSSVKDCKVPLPTHNAMRTLFKMF